MAAPRFCHRHLFFLAKICLYFWPLFAIALIQNYCHLNIRLVFIPNCCISKSYSIQKCSYWPEGSAKTTIPAIFQHQRSFTRMFDPPPVLHSLIHVHTSVICISRLNPDVAGSLALANEFEAHRQGGLREEQNWKWCGNKQTASGMVSMVLFIDTPKMKLTVQ